MKKIFVLFLAVLMLAGTMPITAMAHTDIDDYDYDKYMKGVSEEEYEERFASLLREPGLKAGDLLKAGHPNVQGLIYDGFGNLFDCAYIEIRYIDTAERYSTWQSYATDSQWDWIIWGSGVEFTGPPILTYEDGTVVVGTHEILADGEHATIQFDASITSGRFELFVPYRVVNGDSEYTYTYTFISGLALNFLGYQYTPEGSARSPYSPSRSGGTKKVSDLITIAPSEDLNSPMDAKVVSDPIPPAGGSSTNQERPSAWAVSEVDAAIAATLVPQGLQSKYTQTVTRAEYCALAVALYEAVTGGEITERAQFSDTSDVNVEKMAALEVVNGVGDNKFAPDEKLTREQAATMLSRLAKAIGKPLPTTDAPPFADYSDVSAWAVDAVSQMQATGIMGGVGNNTFAPKADYTREQSIITMIRLFDIVK